MGFGKRAAHPYPIFLGVPLPPGPKLDEAVDQVQFDSQRNFSNPIISKLDKQVVLLPIHYIASKIDEHGKYLTL